MFGYILCYYSNYVYHFSIVISDVLMSEVQFTALVLFVLRSFKLV